MHDASASRKLDRQIGPIAREAKPGATAAEVCRPAWIRYLGAFGIVALAALARWLADGVMGDRTPYAIFFFSVAIVAWRWGAGPTVLAIVLGALVGHWLFVPPRYHMGFATGADVLSFCLYLVISSITAAAVHSLHSALRRAEQSAAKITAIYRNSPAAIAITRLSDGAVLEVNAAIASMLGYSRDELLGRTSVELRIWADVADRERMVRLVSTGGAVRGLEFAFRRKDGSLITTEYSGMLIELGGEKCLLSSFVDITQRKLADEALRESRGHYQALAEHNRRLLQELEHRVRNNLAGLLGLVTAMRNEGKDVAAFAAAIEGRLMGMAHVQTLLVDANWGRVDLRVLATSTLAAMEPMLPYCAKVEIEGPAVALSADMVMPLALVLVEWVTNSCKYGAHSAPGGRVSIRWRLCADADRRVRLTWKEQGGPPIHERPVPSLGSTLVQSFVERDLRGQCHMSYPADGAEHVIEIPCPQG